MSVRGGGQDGVEAERQRERGLGGSIGRHQHPQIERGFVFDNPLVRIHSIIEMIWWTGLAPWEFEIPFPGSLNIYLPES